jgi:hypothetical protein
MLVTLADLAQARPPAPQAVPTAPPPEIAAAPPEVQQLWAQLADLRVTAQDSAAQSTVAMTALLKKTAYVKALQQQLAAMQAGVLGVREQGLSGSGAAKWYFGQIALIQNEASQGNWSAMLLDLSRITPDVQASQTPDQVLSDQKLVQNALAKLDEVYQNDPAMGFVAKTALASMAAQFGTKVPPPAGQASQYQDLYAKAVQAELDADKYQQRMTEAQKYIASHQHDGNEILKAAKKTMQATAWLDKTVPGWTSILDVVAPAIPVLLPLDLALKSLPIVSTVAPLVLPLGTSANALNAASVGAFKNAAESGLFATGKSLLPWAGSPVTTIATLPTVGGAAAAFGPSTAFFSPGAFGAGLVVQPISNVAVTVGQAISPFKYTLLKSTTAAIAAPGPLLAKLDAFAHEVVNAYSFAVTLLCALGGPTNPACLLGSALVAVMKAGLSVLDAKVAADKLREVSREILRQALAKARILDAQAAAIQKQIDAIEAERRRLVEEGASGVLGQIAALLGVSQRTVLVGGVATAWVAATIALWDWE